MNHLLCFGFGFSAQHLARRLDPSDWKISGTSRSSESATGINALGYEGLVFDDLKTIPKTVTHILSSVQVKQIFARLLVFVLSNIFCTFYLADCSSPTNNYFVHPLPKNSIPMDHAPTIHSGRPGRRSSAPR